MTNETPAESPAETIRRAAALMRQRAEAATPGPWSAHRYWVFDQEIWRINTPPVGGECIEVVGGFAEKGGVHAQSDAEHIASWHPIVVLAVADLFNALAHDMEFFGAASSPKGLLVLDGEGGFRNDWTLALAAARAYLGEVS